MYVTFKKVVIESKSILNRKKKQKKSNRKQIDIDLIRFMLHSKKIVIELKTKKVESNRFVYIKNVELISKKI